MEDIIRVERAVHRLHSTVSSLLEGTRFNFLPDVQTIIVADLLALERELTTLIDSTNSNSSISHLCEYSRLNYKAVQIAQLRNWFTALNGQSITSWDGCQMIRAKLELLESILKQIMAFMKGSRDSVISITGLDTPLPPLETPPPRHVTFQKEPRWTIWTKTKLFWIVLLILIWFCQIYVLGPSLKRFGLLIWSWFREQFN